MKVLYLILLHITWVIAQDAPPVRVTVFYETLCRDSHRFMTDQLYPTFKELGSIVDVDTNAYGKANTTASDGGYIFHCQHGDDECRGNMLIGCARTYIEDPVLFQDYTFCIMNSFFPPEEGEICADQLGVDYTPIGQCYTTIEGQEILADVGEKQGMLAPDLDYVPWVIINDVWTPEMQQAAEFGLKEVVCETYTGDILPDACQVKTDM